MPGFLEQAKSGILKKPMFITIYGTPKVGKTTFVSDAESPIIIDIERGSANIQTTRLTPTNYSEVIKMLTELATLEHSFKTVGLDSLDHLEALVWKEVCRREGKGSIEKVGGGYAKGYIEALKEWSEIISLLEKCRHEKGMTVICVAHTHVKSVNDPTQMMNYERYQIKLHEKASALFKEISDVILFAKKEVNLIEAANGKMKGVGEGKSVLFTNNMPSYEAGNRYGLPATLPLDYKIFRAAVDASRPDDPKILLEQIQGLIDQVQDEETKRAVLEFVEKNKDQAEPLTKTLNRLKVLTSKN